MKFARGRALLSASLLVSLGIPLALFASCAESASDASPPDAAIDVDAGVADANIEGGCDASDESCGPAISCDQAPWCPVATGLSPFSALTSVWGSAKSDVWAVGSNGAVLHWDGAAWTTTPTNVKNTFNTVWGSGPKDVWIASATDTVFHSEGYAGATTEWKHVPMPLEEVDHAPVFAIWGTSADDVRLCGRAFGLLDEAGDVIIGNIFSKTTLGDGGIGWKPVPGTSSVLGMWGVSANDFWLVADNSLFVDWQRSFSLHGTAVPDGGGLAWTEIDTRTTVTLHALWGSTANDIWAVGDMGTIRHISSASSSEWQIMASPTTQRLRAIWGSAADDVWAVGDAGTILHYDGHAWNKTLAAFPAGKKPALHGVWGSARDDVWIVGDGVALHYTGGELDAEGGSP